MITRTEHKLKNFPLAKGKEFSRARRLLKFYFKSPRVSIREIVEAEAIKEIASTANARHVTLNLLKDLACNCT